MTEAVKTIDDSGPAFPCEGGADSGLYTDPGMSLRDWFAGQALIGFGTWFPSHCQCGLANPDTMGHRARLAYQQSDAMISARKAGA